MPWSYHSHSGEFCCHGAGKLEECVQAAIAVRYQAFSPGPHLGTRVSQLKLS